MAVFGITPFTFHLSGGAANTDPDASLGGAMSTAALYSNTAAYAAGSIAGVSVEGGHFMDSGTGQLRYTVIGQTLAWKAPGDVVFGPEFDVGLELDGVGNVGYIGTEDWLSVETSPPTVPLPSPAALLAIEVDIASLGLTDLTVDVTVGQDVWALFSDVTEAESDTGAVKYRGVYLKCNYPVITNMKTFFADQPAGDFLSVSLAGGVNTELETLADEYAIPVDSNFEPEVSGLIGTVIGDFMPLWIRQRIPALNETAFTNYPIKAFARALTRWAGLGFASTVTASEYARSLAIGAGRSITYSVVLAGTPNLVLVPIYFTVTKYATKYNTADGLTVSIVALDIDVGDIYDRKTNDLEIIQTITYENGAEIITSIDAMTLVGVESYGGGNSRTLVLKGEKTSVDTSGSVYADLPISKIEGKLISDGVVSLEIPAAEALSIEPGHTVTVEGIDVLVDNVSITVRADEVTALVTRADF